MIVGSSIGVSTVSLQVSLIYVQVMTPCICAIIRLHPSLDSIIHFLSFTTDLPFVVKDRLLPVSRI